MFFRSQRHNTRREFLGAGLVGTLGLALSPSFQRLLAAEGGAPARQGVHPPLAQRRSQPHRHLRPQAGLAKPNGPFKAIDTTVPGMKFSEHLPKLAEQAKHLPSSAR